jgi:hypothetical protein
VWLGASAVGVALIVLLPEASLGKGRLFSLSERHGPSASDSVGLVLVIGGWAVYLVALWRHRGELTPRRRAAWLAGAAVAASAGCVAAIVAGQDGWAAALGLVAVASQIALGCMTRTEA